MVPPWKNPKTGAAQAGAPAERRVPTTLRDWSDEAPEARFDGWADVERALDIPARALTLDENFDAAMRTNKASTRRRYRGCLSDLERFLGTRDLGTATPDRIRTWIDDLASRMVGEDKEARRAIGDETINKCHLAAARSFYGWAVRRMKLKSNPALDIHVEVRRRPMLRLPCFTDEQRDLILSETWREKSGRESPEFGATRRWVPWLCLYTGAQVSEIARLRGQDVKRRMCRGEVIWTVTITAKAGSRKTGEPREVPLHPHLVEQGFPEFAKAKGPGPLFYDPDRREAGLDENPRPARVGEKLAEWLRKIGIPKGAAPNRVWRHHFHAIARRADVPPEIRDAITGRKSRMQDETLGDWISWDVMWPEIERLPWFRVERASGALPNTPRRQEASATTSAS